MKIILLTITLAIAPGCASVKLFKNMNTTCTYTELSELIICAEVK